MWENVKGKQELERVKMETEEALGSYYPIDKDRKEESRGEFLIDRLYEGDFIRIYKDCIKETDRAYIVEGALRKKLDSISFSGQ